VVQRSLWGLGRELSIEDIIIAGRGSYFAVAKDGPEEDRTSQQGKSASAPLLASWSKANRRENIDCARLKEQQLAAGLREGQLMAWQVIERVASSYRVGLAPPADRAGWAAERDQRASIASPDPAAQNRCRNPTVTTFEPPHTPLNVPKTPER
jgi:hypothetical protein